MQLNFQQSNTLPLEQTLGSQRAGQAPLEQYLSYRDLGVYLSASLSTLKRMVERGELPEPVRITERTVRFKLSDLKNYPLFKQEG